MSACVLVAQPIVEVTPWVVSVNQIVAARANSFEANYYGLPSAGIPGNPDYYVPWGGGPVPIQNLTRSDSFNTWLGVVNPGSAFGPNYANERGNGLAFGFRVIGNGTKVSISQLSLSITTNHPWGMFNFSSIFLEYSPTNIGLDYGPDGIRGTADDVWYNNAPRSQLFDEILGAGPAVSFVVYPPNHPLVADQAWVDQELSFRFSTAVLGGDSFLMTAAFAYQSAEWGLIQAVNVQTISAYTPVPEPATTAVIVAGAALGIALWRRRKIA